MWTDALPVKIGPIDKRIKWIKENLWNAESNRILHSTVEERDLNIVEDCRVIEKRDSMYEVFPYDCWI